jgi:diguanylate cyclase (GGDEF)-like protein/PAS domain S-box-containing protein
MEDINLLIVDDNPAIHHDFRKILLQHFFNNNLQQIETSLFGKSSDIREYNFIISSAYQGEEALNIVKQELMKDNHFALAYIDVRMPPGRDGIEVIKELWSLDTEIQIVICTAYADYSWEELCHQLGITDRLTILKKPFENIEVLQLSNTLAKKWLLNRALRTQLFNLEKTIEDRTLSLKKSLSLVRATLEAATDAVLVLNKENNVIDFNNKFLKMFQLPNSTAPNKEDLIKSSINNQLSPHYDLFKQIEKLANDNLQEYTDILRLRTGNIIEYFLAPQIVDNKVAGTVICFRDITKSKTMEEELKYQATHDSLTGAVNRVVLFDRINQEIFIAKRNQKLVAILFVDLDNFKSVNDSYGHDAGDKLLSILARRLKKNIREGDTLARFGGDEFIIVLPGLDGVDIIFSICHMLLQKIAEPVQLESQVLRTTASIGISIYPKDGNDVHTLIINADTAHRTAKKTRDSIQFFTAELDIHAQKRLALENSLRQAVERQELCVYYQPILDLDGGQIQGVEALLRWRHPQLDFIPPQEFIPIAEETGLIMLLGDYVLETACLELKDKHILSSTGFHVAVNFTSRQLAESGFLENMMRLLDKLQLIPSNLELELTESTIIEASDKIIRILQELKAVGIKIVIDDFGTGYSNLSYLYQLPIDKIKIDRSFISYLRQNPNSLAVIRAIISMAKSLKIKVAAEGIETKEQLEILNQNDCDEVQGYYICPPLPLSKLIKFLRHYKPFQFFQYER